MWPCLQNGDLCFVSFDEAAYGDLVCLRDKETKEFVIHRLLSSYELDTSKLKVKGDNALYWDDMSVHQYIGVVKKIKRNETYSIVKPNLRLSLLSYYTHVRKPKVIRVVVKVIMKLISL